MRYKPRQPGKNKLREMLRNYRKGRKSKEEFFKKKEKRNIQILSAAINTDSVNGDIEMDVSHVSNVVDDELELNTDLVELLNTGPERWKELDDGRKLQRITDGWLFAGSRMTRKGALQLLIALKLRFKITDALLNALLKMLNEKLLPIDNILPRCLHSFYKEIEQLSPLQIIQQNKHFALFDLESQLQSIIEHNFASFARHRNMAKHCNFYDIYGDLYRENLESYISLALYTDGGQLSISSKISFFPLLAFILDLPPKLQKTMINTLWMGIYVGESKPNWMELLNELVNESIIPFTDHGPKYIVIGNKLKFKIRILEAQGDNISQSEIFFIKAPGGYFSCTQCMIHGEYDKDTGSVLYRPSNNAARTHEQWTPNLQQNGIFRVTPLKKILKLPYGVQLDCMHCTDKGIFKRCYEFLYEKAKRYFDEVTSHTKLYKPLEFNRHLRPFKTITMWKANEFRRHCLFFAVILLQDLSNNRGFRLMVSNLLLLCSATNVLASKNLTRPKIQFAHRVLQRWHHMIGIMFGSNMWTHKAHAHLHYAEKCLQHGSIMTRTCYTGESRVGDMARCVTDPCNALKQIIRYIKGMAIQSDTWSKTLFSTQQTESRIKFEILPSTLDPRCQQYLRDNFDKNARILCAREIKFEHLCMKSCQFAPCFEDGKKINDSVIYIENNNGHIRPALVEVFVEITEDICSASSSAANIQQSCQAKQYALVRGIYLRKEIAKTLNWTEPIETRLLLTDLRSFPDCFECEGCGERSIDKKIVHVSLDKIRTKGFLLEYRSKSYCFALNAFEHD